MHERHFSVEIAGKTLTATFNNLAERSNGSVLIHYGNTLLLVTAVLSKSPRSTSQENNDFLPLTVEYEEKFYAAGQILGNRYSRREGKPSDEAILSARIIDRTIRPLFDPWIRNEIQIVVSVLSIGQDDPDVLSVIGTSLALSTSDIPWNGPVSAVRVAGKKGSKEHIINPEFKVREQGTLDFELVACGKDNTINMLELGGNEISEADAIDAIQSASEEIEKIQEFQKQIILELGKEKVSFSQPEYSEHLQQLFRADIFPTLEKELLGDTRSGDSDIERVRETWLTLVRHTLIDDPLYTNKPAIKLQAHDVFEQEIRSFLQKQAIEKGWRADGRNLNEIRPLFVQAGGLSETLHGSGIFYRGQTHVLSVLTLGESRDAQVINNIEEHVEKRYIHHYNFPPFSTGETGRVGGINRRMIGHGALAEKALLPVLPKKDIFPYTIRIVSEVLSSNGSTSMASVCGSTVALMDGGVPISRPVAGISIGLFMRQVPGGDKHYVLLTDIQGPEDHYGDMDFKVAGTKQGITAIQMDIKISGIQIPILVDAFEQARLARLTILDTITKTIPAPRKNISLYAPKIIIIKIRPEMIGLVIGPGGKTIQSIISQTGVGTIDVENDGNVYITGKNGSSEKAYQAILDIIKIHGK